MEPTPAPAPQEAPEPTISAGMDAATRGDYSAFETAQAAVKRGAPLADVPAPEQAAAPVAPGAPAPERVVSKRQQEINDKIRDAVDRTRAEMQAKIDGLQAQITAPKAAAPPAEPITPVAPQAEWKRIAALPDAPKLADFESVEEHTAAMALFVADTRHAEREQAAQQHTTDTEILAAQRARADAFIARIDAAKLADPEFVKKLTPAVRSIKPFGALAKDEKGGPINVIGEHVYDSPVSIEILRHFSDQPEVLDQLLIMPAAIAALPSVLRAPAHIKHINREFAKLETRFETAPAAPAPPVAVPSAITAAPPPAPTLSKPAATTDPKASAVARGDFGTFDKLEMQRKRQERTHATA